MSAQTVIENRAAVERAVHVTAKPPVEIRPHWFGNTRLDFRPEQYWKPGTQVTVDLQAKTVSYGDTSVPFEIEDYVRWRLLEGLDDVGLTERHIADIEAYEARRPAWLPTAQPA